MNFFPQILEPIVNLDSTSKNNLFISPFMFYTIIIKSNYLSLIRLAVSESCNIFIGILYCIFIKFVRLYLDSE